MFEKIKSAFGSLSKLATHKSISKEDVDSILWDFEIALIESDVAQEVIERITSSLKEKLEGTQILREQDKLHYVRSSVRDAIRDCFAKTKKIDLLALIDAKESRNTASEFSPFVILFLGINGVGKTSTVAKIAYLLKSKGRSVVVACGDTHRAGAIEQLTEHANRLKIKAIAQSYGSDPAAVAKDALLYAEAHRIEVVLIDTAGRMQTSTNLMEEMSKIVRVVKPDLKFFVGDSLSGNDTVSQAREFEKFTDFDGAILTKADADAKGGGALSIAFTTERPIIYLSTGQDYPDLVPFDIEKFLDTIL
ncbi:MAG: signal recognition particle-docking protein FtsY [Nitrososphaerales archaeon]